MGPMETSVTTTVVVVWRDVTETRGSVWGRVQLELMVHVAKWHAVWTVKVDAIKAPEFVPSV